MDCPAPSVVSDDHVRCYGCPPGRAPNDARTDCLACDSLDGLRYSTQGIECAQCEGDNVVNAARTMCVPCVAGSGPNVNRTECVPCTDRFYGDILGFSQVGVCNHCPEPNVVNEDRTTCMACPAGDGRWLSNSVGSF